MKIRQILLFPALLIASSVAGFSLYAQPTTVGMLAYFNLNGNPTNTGPANITATVNNMSYTTNNAGSANSAVQFGGNLNSWIDFTDNGNLDFSGATNFTVSFSFYFNGSSTSGLIDNCLNHNGWGIWLWSTVSGVWNLQFNYRNASVGSAASTAFSLNAWHHVAAVRNNGTISLYIDGVFRLSATEGTGTPSYPINMIAGAMGYSLYSPPRYNPFNGKMDEIRIYNRALSAAEIATLAPYALPLQLGDFTAVKKPNSIQLNWETLSEQNTSLFTIERSGDGISYSAIGTVNAAGNSTDKRTYSFMDMNALPKNNFYRLKMTGIDGAFTYSRVVVIKNDNNQLILTLFPNPVTDLLQIQIPADRKEITRIMIIDGAGKQVYLQWMQLNEGMNAASIPVSHLSKGSYYFIAENENKRRSGLFIKQ